MIRSRTEYRLTKMWAEKFEEHAARFEDGNTTVKPPEDERLRQSVIDSLKGQAAELRAELAEWDAHTEKEREEIIGRGQRG
jgi:hypothetical protein